MIHATSISFPSSPTSWTVEEATQDEMLLSLKAGGIDVDDMQSVSSTDTDCGSFITCTTSISPPSSLISGIMEEASQEDIFSVKADNIDFAEYLAQSVSPTPTNTDSSSFTAYTTSTSPLSSPKSETVDEKIHEETILSAKTSDIDFVVHDLPPIPDSAVPSSVDDVDTNTPDKWVRREPSMVRLTGKHPFNSEARLDKLFAAGFLTPTSLFYVRNHGAVPHVDQAENWRLRIHGLVEREVEFSLEDLKNKFQVVTLPVTLVCAGNRRKEQNVVKKSVGFNWGAAGISTGLFTGVYLADVLDYVRPIRPKAKYVVFEGSDTDLPNGPYGTSQTLKNASSIEKGMMIVWGMNGKALAPDHGFPLRVVIPGQIGGRSVKWLRKIEVSDQESHHYVGML